MADTSTERAQVDSDVVRLAREFLNATANGEPEYSEDVRDLAREVLRLSALPTLARTPGTISVPIWAVFEERGETFQFKDGTRRRSTYCRFCNSEVIPAGEKYDSIYDHRPAC